MITKCPGAQSFRQPKPEYMKCPFCSYEVEIWSDEIVATCPKCKRTVMRNDGKQSCLDWCKYAEKCVGVVQYNKYKQNKSKYTGGININI